MRRVWVGIILLLLIGLPVSLALALQSQGLLLQALDWAMARFTDYHLEIDNPHIDLPGGRLSADEIHLIKTGSDAPPLVSVLKFTGKTRVGDLLTGNLANSSLAANEVLVHLTSADDARQTTPMEWLDYLAWLPQQLRVSRARLLTDAETSKGVSLLEIRGDRRANRVYEATAGVEYQGEPLEMALQLHALRNEARFTGLELSGSLLAPERGRQLSMQGGLLGTKEELSYDFSVLGEHAEFGEVLQGFEKLRRLEGKLHLEGNLKGNSKGFTLSDVALVLDNMPEYGFEAGGSIEYWFGGEHKLDIVAAGEMSSLEYLLDWVDVDLTGLGRAQASLEVSGTLKNPYIDQFIFTTAHDDGLAITISGRAIVPQLHEKLELQRENHIRLDLSGPSLATLEPWIGKLDLEPGPWRATAELVGHRDHIGLRDGIIEVGSRDTVKLRLEGNVDNFTGVIDQGLAGVRGIDAVLTGYTPNTSHVAELLDIEIPADHVVNSSIHLQGNGDRISAQSGRIEVSTEGVSALLNVRGGIFQPQGEYMLSQVIADIRLGLEDSASAQRYVKAVEIPALGPVDITAGLVQDDRRYSLVDIRAHTESDRQKLDVTGSVSDLVRFQGVNLGARFYGVGLAKILEYLIDDYHYDRDLGELQGRFSLRDQEGLWHLTDIDIDTAANGGPVELDISGSVAAVATSPRADMQARYRVRDTQLLEILTGLRLNPLAGSARAYTRRNEVIYSGRMNVGDTSLSLGGVLEHGGGAIRSMRLALTSPHLHLDNLGLQATKKGGDAYNPSDQVEAEAVGALRKILEGAPPPFPVQLKLKINQITGDNTNIEDADMYLTSEDGRYTLRKLTVRYADTTLEMRGMIDLNAELPAISVGIQAIDIPMHALSRDLGINTDVSGLLALRGGLTTFGSKREDQLKNLDGELAVALKDAVIAGGSYDVLATDFLAWIYSGAALQDSTKLDCTMMYLSFANGQVKTDSLYIETPQMIATGKGKLDMIERTIDLTLTPISKSRTLQVPSSVRIRGPLDNPTPIISPVTAAMDLSAEALTIIPRMTLKIFGIKSSSRKQQRPCGHDQ